MAGCVVITGAVGLTVKVAGLDVADPATLVKTARYCLPLSVAWAVKLYVVEVAPGISDQELPPFALTCHCTVGLGFPLAAALKLAVCPALTVWLLGWLVITGAMLTVSVAALLVADPATLVKTARYCLPLSVA